MQRVGLLAIFSLGILILGVCSGSKKKNFIEQHAEQAVTVKSFVAPGHNSGAVGDGKSDDTESLQAAINHAIQVHAPLRLEPGVYRITKGLVVEDTSTPFPMGFDMEGDAGPNRGGNPGTGGVSILLDGSATGEQAILTFGHGGFRDLIMRNIGFVSRVPNNGTKFGILFSGSKFSHAMLENLQVGAVDTAYGVVSGGPNEGNGEQLDLTGCMGNYVKCFYSNSYGQAYNHHLIDCNCTLKNGGTAIKIGAAPLGFSLDAVGFTSSFGRGPLQNVFLENDGISGNVNFFGGRQEAIDTLVSYSGGSHNCAGMIAMYGLKFTNFGERFPIIQGLHSSDVSDYTNSFSDCMFDATPKLEPKISVAIQPKDNTMDYFDRCTFKGFSNTLTALGAPQIHLRDCRSRVQSGIPLAPIPSN